MQIHIARNGERFGPYPLEVVQGWLTSGKLNAYDLAWHNGLAQWMPLGTVMNTLPGVANIPMPVAVIPKSRLAKASFMISIVTSCVWVLIFTSIIAFRGGQPLEEQGEPVFMAAFIVLLNIAANLVGGVLGLIVATKPISNKWMAIVGVIINGIEFSGMAFLMIYSIAHQNLIYG